MCFGHKESAVDENSTDIETKYDQNKMSIATDRGSSLASALLSTDSGDRNQANGQFLPMSYPSIWAVSPSTCGRLDVMQGVYLRSYLHDHRRIVCLCCTVCAWLFVIFDVRLLAGSLSA